MAIEKGYPINRIAFFYVYIPVYPLPLFYARTLHRCNYNLARCFFVYFHDFARFQMPKIDAYINFNDV